jgi:hypothetical protein
MLSEQLNPRDQRILLLVRQIELEPPLERLAVDDRPGHAV